MATFTMTMIIGANTTTKTISPTNARMLQFLDDIILVSPEVDDGAGDRLWLGQPELPRGGEKPVGLLGPQREVATAPQAVDGGVDVVLSAGDIGSG